MARAQSTDFLHSMRFQVDIVAGYDFFRFSADGKSSTVSPSAGFMSVSTPEATTEAVEYREGTYNYPRKFPGNTTVSDCSMQKGVARADGSFWNWMSTVIAGNGEYRVDMAIYHFDRRVLNRPQNGATKDFPNFANLATANNAARTYTLFEAFPTRHKVAADLDASSSDISIMELDVAYEYFDVKEGTPTSATGSAVTAEYKSSLPTAT
jgi:phage tail-like protein